MNMAIRTRKAKLDELEGLALKRLGEIIRKGSDKDALAAADMVLKRTAPEPKVNTAADAARGAAMGAAAGASVGLAALAAKAQARALPAPAPIDITPRAERAPLVDVSTLGKGGN